MKNIPSKVVIRHLPPKLSEDSFKEMIKPIPEYDYFRFCQPDSTLGKLSFCRAYINFSDPHSVFLFRERFTDYIFVDEEGNEASAVVEFAVFQGTPIDASRTTKRVDKRQGTIDEDPDYLAFLKDITAMNSSASTAKEGEKKQTPWEAMLETIKHRSEAVEVQPATPLISYLNQRLERRKRHAIEDAKSQIGQKNHQKSTSGFRTIAKPTRSQVASRRFPEYTRRQNESRTSVPEGGIMGKDSVSQTDSNRKQSDISGGKLNSDSNQLAAEKSASTMRCVRKSKRRTSNEINSNVKPDEEESQIVDKDKSKSRILPESRQSAIHSTKGNRDVDHRSVAADSCTENVEDSTIPAKPYRQWGGGSLVTPSVPRSQNVHTNARYDYEAVDSNDDGGNPIVSEKSRGRFVGGRFTSSRGKRGNMGVRQQHYHSEYQGQSPSSYSSRHADKQRFADFEENSPKITDGPPNERGYRGRGGNPRTNSYRPR